MTVGYAGMIGHFQLLVARNGQRIEQIHTDAGLIVGLTGYRVDISGCAPGSLIGRYPYNMKGWGLSGGPVAFPSEQLLSGYFPFVMSGVMEFHAGSITAWDTASLNGIVLSRTLTGWYTVNPDCTGNIALADSFGNSFTLEMLVDKSGGAVHLVNTDTIALPGFSSPVPAFVLGATLDPEKEK
jgi:hypothetical protein